MADNVAITAGAGTTIAADDIGAGVLAQRVKPVFGPDGTGTDVSSTTPMPVTQKATTLTIQTGSITTAATTVTATTDIPQAGTVMVVIGGTYAGVNLTFEGSPDGTIWFPMMGQRVDSPVTELTSGVLTANQIRAWDFPAAGCVQFRVRSTAYTSGTGSVFIVPTPFALEPIPSVSVAQTATATQTGVAASASSVTILAANPARRGATVANDTTSVNLYLRLSASAAAATSGNYTVMLTAGAYYEVPFGYSGQITGIWTAATGFANVTEIV